MRQTRKRTASWKVRASGESPTKIPKRGVLVRKTETPDFLNLDDSDDLGETDEPDVVRPVPVVLRIAPPRRRRRRRSLSGSGNRHSSVRSIPAVVRIAPPRASKRELQSASRVPHLPKDVLVAIFSNFEPVPHLCILSQVCTRWADAATVPELWTRVKASDAVTRRLKVEESKANYRYVCYDSPFAGGTKGRSRKLTRRRLRGAPHAIDVITRRAGLLLKSLDLEDCFPTHREDSCQMTNESLETIAKRSPSLEELRISPSVHITGQGLVQFAQKCPNLRILHMRGCRTLTSLHLGIIVRSCPLLEDISVTQCVAFRGRSLDECLHPICNTLKRLDVSDTLTTKLPLHKFIFVFRALEEIKIDNCVYIDVTGPVPDLVAVQGSLLPSLTTLNIDKTSRIPLNWLKALCQTCPTFKFLSANMVQSQEPYVGSLFDGALPAIQHLSLAGQPLDDGAWQMIFQKLRKSLVQCDVSRNVSLTCALDAAEGETFSSLEQLNVSGTGATDWTVKEVIRVAPKLLFLDLTGCRSVEDRVFRRDPLAFRDTADFLQQ